MSFHPDQLRQFWTYMGSSWKFRWAGVGLIALFLFFNYRYHFSINKFIGKGKQALTCIYIIMVLLNVLYYWVNWDGTASTPQKGTDRKGDDNKGGGGGVHPTGPGAAIDYRGKAGKQSAVPTVPTVPTVPMVGLPFTRHQRCVTNFTKKMVAAKQKWKCGNCGRLLDETYEIDHIVPLFMGGTNSMDNLMALDPICHKKKTLRQRWGGSL